MDVLAPVTAPVATEALRCFATFNETTQHGCEIDATSHEDAAARYRTQYAVQGYARIKTSDAEVFFSLREGNLHQTHHTYGPEGAPQRGAAWEPHFAPARASKPNQN